MAKAECIACALSFDLTCLHAQSLAAARGAGGRASYCGGTHKSARPPAPRTERFHRGVLGSKLPPRCASFLSSCSPWLVHSRSLWRQCEGQAGGPHTAGVRTNRPAHLPLALSDSIEARWGSTRRRSVHRFCRLVLPCLSIRAVSGGSARGRRAGLILRGYAQIGPPTCPSH